MGTEGEIVGSNEGESDVDICTTGAEDRVDNLDGGSSSWVCLSRDSDFVLSMLDNRYFRGLTPSEEASLTFGEASG